MRSGRHCPRPTASPLELWGGIECTVNRVGDSFFDQLTRPGMAPGREALDRFAALGLRALRFPVLWETTAPRGPDSADWRWADPRLEHLRALGLPPIVGLVHHGSGPPGTSLADPAFPEGLAAFARAVAERYPWVDRYTPVNEPLTTARFSGLYGHWYPHGRDDRTFITALLTECRAVVLAMRAVREVNPCAQLVQTDDFGKTFGRPALAEQIDFDNERRWFTWDLLCGRIDRHHPMWAYAVRSGIDEREIGWFLDNPCPPDIVGVNSYVTSQRFLDERVDQYPEWARGGNGTQAYADVDAFRVAGAEPAGPEALLREVWDRYRLPVAITEVHLGCTREGQLRWLLDRWEAARRLREDGVDVRAVTVWSLLGAFDWDSLVTSPQDHYEPGAFDVRAPSPRPTALASLIGDVAAGREPDHPVLDGPGWWHRPERVLYPEPVVQERPPAPIRGGSEDVMTTRTDPPLRSRGRPLLITGARGTLGRAFARICDERGLAYRLAARAEMDMAVDESVRAILEETRPWAVVNAAGYVRVDDAERESELCFRENTTGPVTLARRCADRGIPLVTYSSDLVFDGSKGAPYVEWDPVSPLNVYGESKARAEERVLLTLPSALVIRTSAFFGPWDEYNFVTIVLRELRAGRTFIAASDAVVSPTYVPDLVNASLDLLIDGEGGLWHLANDGAVTWADLARDVARRAGLDFGAIEARPTADLGLVAARPLYSVLGSERSSIMPSLEEALDRYARDVQVDAVRVIGGR